MPEISDLTPVNRVESILDGENLTPVNRLEYFLAKAAEGGGGGGSVYSPILAQTTKSVSSHWVSGFSGGPILEDANYRVIVNGTTYEPLTGTAGEDGFICLGNTYVDDSDPSGDYGFGIFYKNNQLSAWLETGDSMTIQIDQIIQAVPVPTPAAADTGKVLTANNGTAIWDTINEVPDGEAGEAGFYLSLDNSLRPIWQQSVAVFNTTISGAVYTFNSTWQVVKNRFMAGLAYVRIENDICAILAVTEYPEGNQYKIRVAMNIGVIDFATNTPLGYPLIDLD